jgi:hypothetical protein
MRRRALGLVAALGAALVLAGPVPAASAAACSGSSGVTVVVDYGALGGIQVGCAAGDPGSGLSALHGAGFGTVGTQKDGPAFVCRINGVPAADPCVLTPPSSAYWSYWHGSRGGSWGYSSLGAAGYNPAPGSVEGWSYGAGGRPGIAPPAAPAPPAPPAPKPTAKPAPKPTVKPAPPRTSAPGVPGTPRVTAAPGAPGTPTPGRSSTSTAAPSSSSSASATTPAPSTSAGASGTPTSTAVAGTEATEEPGPPDGSTAAVETAHSSVLPVVGTVLGVLLVIALAVVAFVVTRRRRTAL